MKKIVSFFVFTFFVEGFATILLASHGVMLNCRMLVGMDIIRTKKSGRLDLNQRPHGPEPSALAN